MSEKNRVKSAYHLIEDEEIVYKCKPYPTYAFYRSKEACKAIFFLSLFLLAIFIFPLIEHFDTSGQRWMLVLAVCGAPVGLMLLSIGMGYVLIIRYEYICTTHRVIVITGFIGMSKTHIFLNSNMEVDITQNTFQAMLHLSTVIVKDNSFDDHHIEGLKRADAEKISLLISEALA